MLLSRAPRQLWFSLCLSLLLPRTSSRGEDSVSYKIQSWQEEDGRIRVDSQSAMIEKNFSPDTRFKLTGVIDAIAGATPNGSMHTVVFRDITPLSTGIHRFIRLKVIRP